MCKIEWEPIESGTYEVLSGGKRTTHIVTESQAYEANRCRAEQAAIAALYISERDTSD